MKKRMSVLLLMGVLTVSMFAGCGSQAADTAAEAEAATAEDVQDTLTYFGSLKANDSDDQFAVFKSADGDLVYLFMFDGELNYGIPTEDTGNATTDDGQEYATVKLGDTEYGYGFTNDDATEGFLVDPEGNIIPATELGEEGARELVEKTF